MTNRREEWKPDGVQKTGMEGTSSTEERSGRITEDREEEWKERVVQREEWKEDGTQKRGMEGR